MPQFDHQLIPAIVPYVIFKARGKVLHWLDPESPAYYPSVLLSWVYWVNAKKHKRIPRIGDTIIFGDSGGYSAVTKGAHKAGPGKQTVSPEEVMRWQIRRCTRGVMLDLPPYSRSSKIQFTGTAMEYWKESITLSKDHVRRALPYYQENLDEGGPFRWWGVLQGETYGQMQHWYDEIAEVYPFDQPGEGWALAPKPSTDVLANARYMRFARDQHLSRVHLLQVTSAKIVGVLLALAQFSDQFELVTYDSATAARCAINRNAIYLDGDGLGLKYVKQKGRTGLATDVMLACDCQACVWYRENFSDPPTTNKEFPHLLLLHNHIIMVRAFENIYREVQIDAEAILHWATGGKWGSVIREFEGTHHQAKEQLKVKTVKERLRELKQG